MGRFFVFYFLMESTNVIISPIFCDIRSSLRTAFASIATLMVVSAVLQLSLVSRREWTSLFSRLRRCQESMGFVVGSSSAAAAAAAALTPCTYTAAFLRPCGEIAKSSASRLTSLVVALTYAFGGLRANKKCKAE